MMCMRRYESLNVTLFPGTLVIEHPGIIDHIAREPQGGHTPYNKATEATL